MSVVDKDVEKTINGLGYIGISTTSGIEFIHLLQAEIAVIERDIDKNQEQILELKRKLKEREKTNNHLRRDVSMRVSRQNSINQQLVNMGICGELKYMTKVKKQGGEPNEQA